jgi:hypothetical protein
MDFSSVSSTYQTDKKYTVQKNSSGEVYSSYIRIHYKMYIRRKAPLTLIKYQFIQFTLQYLSKP